MINIISSVVLRGATRNNFVFNRQAWLDVKMVLRRVLKLSMEWQIICKDGKMEKMKKWLSFLEKQISEPLQIASKRLKLSMKEKVPGMMVTEMEKQSAHGKGTPYADI
jgi:hypothetical protein